MKNLNLRKMGKTDYRIISEAFSEQGWHKPEVIYREYYKYQKFGTRDIIVAELNNTFAGYLTINWVSEYLLFKEKGIPEIVDLNVLKKYQRQGIGTALMDEAEKRIKKISQYAGIGFGVTKHYGPAQILYINRNYKPDGNGLVRRSEPLDYGNEITIDDSLVFYLTKEL